MNAESVPENGSPNSETTGPRNTGNTNADRSSVTTRSQARERQRQEEVNRNLNEELGQQEEEKGEEKHHEEEKEEERPSAQQQPSVQSQNTTATAATPQPKPSPSSSLADSIRKGFAGIFSSPKRPQTQQAQSQEQQQQYATVTAETATTEATSLSQGKMHRKTQSKDDLTMAQSMQRQINILSQQNEMMFHELQRTRKEFTEHLKNAAAERQEMQESMEQTIHESAARTQQATLQEVYPDMKDTPITHNTSDPSRPQFVPCGLKRPPLNGPQSAESKQKMYRNEVSLAQKLLAALRSLTENPSPSDLHTFLTEVRNTCSGVLHLQIFMSALMAKIPMNSDTYNRINTILNLPHVRKTREQCERQNYLYQRDLTTDTKQGEQTVPAANFTPLFNLLVKELTQSTAANWITLLKEKFTKREWQNKKLTVQELAALITKDIEKAQTSGMDPDPDWMNVARFIANTHPEMQRMITTRNPHLYCAQNLQRLEFADVVRFASALEQEPAYQDAVKTKDMIKDFCKALQKGTEIPKSKRVNSVNAVTENGTSEPPKDTTYCLGVDKDKYYPIVRLWWKELTEDGKKAHWRKCEEIRNKKEAVAASDGDVKYGKGLDKDGKPRTLVCIDKTNGRLAACENHGHAQHNCPHNKGAVLKDEDEGVAEQKQEKKVTFEEDSAKAKKERKQPKAKFYRTDILEHKIESLVNMIEEIDPGLAKQYHEEYYDV